MNRSYWPDIEATGQLLTDLCEGLSAQYDVHVVCGQPNSPEPNSSFLQAGAEKRHGVTIHRLAHRRFPKGNLWGRIFNFVSFYRAAGRFLRNCNLQADIIVSETDPFLLPIAGHRYARRTGAKHCVYLQDIYPDVAEAVGKLRSRTVARLIRSRLNKAYRDAAGVIVLGRCMRDRLTQGQWKIPVEKIEIIPNWSDCEAIAPIDHPSNAFRKRYCVDDSFVVMHSGNMGLTQRLEVLISAAAEPAWPARAKLLLVGNGASRDALLEHTDRLKLPEGRVQFIHYQPRQKLAESLSAADVHVVSMHEKVTGCLCPSKLYGIMAAARPVIAVADPASDLGQTVTEREIGWVVPPGSPVKIAQAVAEAESAARQSNGYAAYHRQYRARSVAQTSFDRPVIIARFAELFRRLGNDPSVLISEHQLSEDKLAASVERQNPAVALSK